MKTEATPELSAEMGSIEFRDEVVGKRIAGVIARPGRNGQPPVVLMLSFDDGSVVEFVSPRSDRLLRRAIRCSSASHQREPLPDAQLELMPMPSGMNKGLGLN